MNTWPEPEYKQCGDFKLAVHRFGPHPSEADKPTLVMMHGFPELAYSWRYQAPFLAHVGYPILVPDMPGYGKSDKPDDQSLYTMENLNATMAAMLDAYEVDKAVFIGHDWGAILLWGMPFNQGDRMLGAVSLNVALMNWRVDPIMLFRQMLGDDMYMVRFQEKGFSEPILEEDIERTFRFFMRKPAEVTDGKVVTGFNAEDLSLLKLLQSPEESWGGEQIAFGDDLQFYVDAYTEGGFTAPIHWYRNMSHNWEMSETIKVDGKLPIIDIPWLMVTADMDRACPAEQANGMEKMITNYTRVDLEGCGHWSMSEKPREVNSALINWLHSTF